MEPSNPNLLNTFRHSFLIAVLIIFADTIISKARPVPREERSCRFLVASMTNVAVDRILTVCFMRLKRRQVSTIAK